MSLLASTGDTSTTDTQTQSADSQQTQQTQQSATQTATGFVDDSGNFREGWLDRLPQDFADSRQTLAKYRTLPDALKGLVEAQRLIGKRQEGMIKLPGQLKEGATEAEKAAHAQSVAEYRKALGVPESPDKYILKPEQLPEGMEWSDDFGKRFSEVAHKHNIPPQAMHELVSEYIGMEQSRAQAQVQVLAQEVEQGRTQLQDAWKGNFDANLATATRVAKTLGLDVNSPGLRDPNVVIALHRMAGMMSEDKIHSGDFNPTSFPGKDRAQAIISGNSSDPEILRLHKSYMNGDKDTNRLVTDLLKNG